MPIYAYKCSACGHADDVLQKISAAPLTVCPVCGQPAYSKQVTAPQFQLKGSGWYVTDFRGGSGAKEGAKAESSKSEGGKADAKTESSPETKSDTKGETTSGSAPACPVHAAPAAAATTAPAKPAAAKE